jgi:hypothetical protein
VDLVRLTVLHVHAIFLSSVCCCRRLNCTPHPLDIFVSIVTCHECAVLLPTQSADVLLQKLIERNTTLAAAVAHKSPLKVVWRTRYIFLLSFGHLTLASRLY